jgi:hypothetical protein
VKKILAYFTLVFFLLGPAGVRPAQAALPILVPVAVGAVVVVAGALSTGSPALYAKSVKDAADATVDAATGKIRKAMIVAMAIGNTKYGYGHTVEADLSSVTPIAKGNSEYPIVRDALDAATIDDNLGPPEVGQVVETTTGIRKKITSVNPSIMTGNGAIPEGLTYLDTYHSYMVGAGHKYIGGNRYISSSYYVLYYGPYQINNDAHWYSQSIGGTNTTDAVYPIPGYTIDPVKFADSIVPSEDFIDETDLLLGNHPAAINPASVPQPFTTPQVQAAAAAEAAAVSQTAATTAQAAADADPTNTALQIAAAQAAADAAQAAIAADAAVADVAVDEPEPIVIPDLPIPLALPETPEPPLIDFSPFSSLGTGAMEKLPFSLINSVADIFATFEGAPVAPSMDVTLIQGAPSHSLSMIAWEAGAAWWRRMVAIMFHASVVYAILRRWVY